MRILSADEAYGKFQTQGWNSSHVVWFLTDLNYFECQGCTFAFLKRGKFTIFVLEPLFDRGEAVDADRLALVWEEVEAELKPEISLFVSIYDSFLEPLKELGFQALLVGKEPFVDLSDCSPSGKSGKGVRAARNQALRAGLRVEEWAPARVLSHPEMAGEMRELLRQWKSRKLLEFGAFLHAVDPFREFEGRRIFLAFSSENVLQGFQVASPIPARNSFFLEDLVIGPQAARGVAELLTTEALLALGQSNAAQASLGVVALTSITRESGYNLPPVASWTLLSVPKFLSRFYNVSGLELFRKRFKPKTWENVHFALKNTPRSGMSDSRAWILAIYTYLRCHEIRLNFSWRWLWDTVTRPLVKHPVSWGATAVLTATFTAINHGGDLPNWALNKFGFSGDSPVSQWPLRSLTSDILVFNWQHYAVSVVALFFLLRWLERTYRPQLAATFLLTLSFCDDFVNQIIMILPFRYFQPRLFLHLVAIKDVGPSLWIATLVGLRVSTMKKNQEVLFALLTVSCLLAFAFGSIHLSALILNLNHTLFLAIGYVCGRLWLERERALSRKVAKGKPPVRVPRQVAQTPEAARPELPEGDFA